MELKKITQKRADINLSFGVIFSIILIIVFLFAAIYAINFFLDYGKCTQIGDFYSDLQKQVNDAFYSQSVENKKVEISLPSSTSMICFANLSAEITNPGQEYEDIKDYHLEDANLFLFPQEDSCNMPYKNIERINISEITKLKNPYCVYADDTLTLTKRIYDKRVLIK